MSETDWTNPTGAPGLIAGVFLLLCLLYCCYRCLCRRRRSRYRAYRTGVQDGAELVRGRRLRKRRGVFSRLFGRGSSDNDDDDTTSPRASRRSARDYDGYDDDRGRSRRSRSHSPPNGVRPSRSISAPPLDRLRNESAAEREARARREYNLERMRAGKQALPPDTPPPGK